MADDISTNGETAAGVETPEGARLHVLAQYVKDLSFENPNAPRSFTQGEGQPALDVNVDVNVQRLSETDFEVVLGTRITATREDETLFITEVDYAGLFRLINVPQDTLEPILLIECPRQIFPFARRVLADTTRDGGFPPLLLDPIDFVQLYRSRKAQEGAPAQA